MFNRRIVPFQAPSTTALRLAVHTGRVSMDVRNHVFLYLVSSMWTDTWMLLHRPHACNDILQWLHHHDVRVVRLGQGLRPWSHCIHRPKRHHSSCYKTKGRWVSLEDLGEGYVDMTWIPFQRPFFHRTQEDPPPQTLNRTYGRTHGHHRWGTKDGGKNERG